MSASDHWHNALQEAFLAAPLLWLLPSFVAGLLVADYVDLEWWVVMLMMVVSLLMALKRSVAMSLLYANMAIFLFAILVVEAHRYPRHITYNRPMVVEVDVVGIPTEREGYRVAEGALREWGSEHLRFKGCERVQLWIRNDSIDVGDRIVAYAPIQQRMSRYEGYDRLLRNRGYVGGIAVDDYNLERREPNHYHSLQLWGYRTIHRGVSHSTSRATVEAMVTGVRSNIPPNLRDAYSTTGLAHLMAVSGLHMGIVVAIVNLLAAPLVLVHRGHRWRNLVVIAALWLFVVLSGASPSVVRSAVMFSVLQLSWRNSSSYSGLNALAAAAFVILTLWPGALYDMSFLLSVSAVAGILLWGRWLIRASLRDNSVQRWVFSSVFIGLSASAWTLPLVSYYFGNMPIIGLGVTPIAIFTASAIVALGILALITPGWVATPLLGLADWCAELQNRLVISAAKYDWASVEYRMDGEEVVLCYSAYLLITLGVWLCARWQRRRAEVAESECSESKIIEEDD